ncbi:MAG: ribonuclease P protein component [Candidatus Berkelbacteria bacterium]|nr:ribonuclease P protein component [Candidatus Berkelbacteria bacterium]
MLANINRLRKSQDIQRVYRNGRNIGGQNFSLRFLPNRQSCNRFAIVIGTKVEKRATRRNAHRRQIREIIRQNSPTMKSPFDIIITAHKFGNWPIEREIIFQEIEKLFSQI